MQKPLNTAFRLETTEVLRRWDYGVARKMAEGYPQN